MSNPSPGSTRQALLVEDDPEIRQLLRKYLVKLGLEVTEYSDGRAAIEGLKSITPDLVCLDLMLPSTSGYEVCEAVRRTPGLQQVPVLMISARSLPSDRAYAEESGASGYLVKPFTYKQFTELVTSLLAGR